MVKLENLLSKKGFVYLVNGEYYYIGQGVFKECTDSDIIGYFEEYRNLIESLDTNEKRVNYLFRKLMAVSDYKMVELDKYDEVNDKILLFIKSLDKENEEHLLIQLENFVNTYRYFYKKYYL